MLFTFRLFPAYQIVTYQIVTYQIVTYQMVSWKNTARLANLKTVQLQAAPD